MIDLSVVIVSFNTRDFIVQCLESIRKHTSSELEYEVIVVDNASTDGTIGALKSESQNHKSKLKIIRNDKNLGFSKANNIGVKQAKGKYILFLNSDTKLLYKHTLEEMVAFMDFHADAGAATCFLQLVNGDIDDAAHRGFPTPWNALCHFSGLGRIFPNSTLFNGYHLGWKDMGKIHELDALAGAFMIVRRDAGEEVGWWDEDYFFYGEDLDFCYQLKKHGWKIFFVPTVKVLHFKGVSSGIKKISQSVTTADAEGRRKVQKARFEAMKIFYQKHYATIYPKYITWLVMKGIDIRTNISLLKV